MSNPAFSGTPAFEFVSQGRAYPLSYGASFSQNEFPMLAPSTGSGPVAQVSANPNDPSQLGLQNLTAQPWVAYMPDGSQQQIDPGRSARLADGVTMQMGAMQGQIRVAQASGQAAFAPPPFGQPQAQSPFGQPQAQSPFGQPQAQSPFGQPQAQAPGAWPPPPAGGVVGGWDMNAGANDSGTGAAAVLPPQLRGFNVGAFFMNWIWAIGNKTWIGLLALIPYVGLVMAIVLGVKGNEWAWQNRRWDSVQQFQATQKVWMGWGVGLFILGVVGEIAAVVLRSHVPQQ